MENIISTLDHVPVGFRFRPTDEELVSYYLKHKLLGDDFPVHVIPEIDLCRVEPWDVPAKSVIKSDDPEWFFFSSVDYKYSKSTRVNRTTKHGFWKSTGNDRNIRTRGTNNVIGTKKTLVFHEGRVPRGAKTNWVIHEYRALTSHESQNTLVLCRLMKKADKRKEGGIEAPNFLDEISLPEFTLEEILKAAELFPPVEQYDDDDEFVNSIFVDNEEVIINEERRHCFVNSSTQPKSLRRVYNASSDTDAEVVSNLVKLDNVSSGEYSVHVGMSSLASNHEANIEKKESIIQEDFWAVETSSCDSTADEPAEISCSSSTQTQRKVSNNAVSHVEGRKEFATMKSENQKNAQNTCSKGILKIRSQQSSNVNNKASFFYMETTSSNQNLFPRSVYLVNVVIGILLLIVISWDVLLC